MSSTRGTLAIDTDADGIDDATESAMGLNPNDSQDAALDQDGDGFDNLYEYLARSDMSRADSVPDIQEWGGPQRDSRHSGYQPLRLDSANFSVRWSYTSEIDFLSLVTDSQRVFINSVMDEEVGNVTALGASDGSELWQREVKSRYYKFPLFARDGKVWSRDIEAEYEHTLLTLDAGTGQVLGNAIQIPFGTFTDSYLIYNNIIMLEGGYSYTTIGYDLLTGSNKWSTRTRWYATESVKYAASGDVFLIASKEAVATYSMEDGSGLGGFALEGALLKPVIGQDDNVILLSDGLVSSWKITDKQPNWQYASTFGRVSALPAVGNRKVYVADETHIIAIDEATGIELWRREGGTSNFAVTLTHVFVSSGGKTYALNDSDGTVAWEYDASGTLALDADGVLYIVAGNTVHAIALRP